MILPYLKFLEDKTIERGSRSVVAWAEGEKRVRGIYGEMEMF